MRAGKLRHRIAIQSATETLDEYRQATKAWATETTVWGSIEPLTGRELFDAAQVNPEINLRVRLRYYAALTTKKRLQFGDRNFGIYSIANADEMNREMIVLCTELL